jgi:hypothetical protein
MTSSVGVATPTVRALVCVMCHSDGQIWLNIIEKIIPKPKILTENRTQDSFRACALSSCNLLSETNKFCLGAVLIVLSFGAAWNYVRTRTQDSFRYCGICFYNLLFETNNSGLSAVLLLFLVYELQKPSSPGIEHRTIFRGSGLCFCNFLFEANNQSWSHSSIVLSFRATGNDLTGNRTQDIFPAVLTVLCCLPGLKE